MGKFNPNTDNVYQEITGALTGQYSHTNAEIAIAASPGRPAYPRWNA
jgi:hypothetical protein